MNPKIHHSVTLFNVDYFEYSNFFIQLSCEKFENSKLSMPLLHNSNLCNRVRSTLLGTRYVIMTRAVGCVITYIGYLIKYFATSCIRRFMQQRHRKFEILSLFDTQLHKIFCVTKQFSTFTHTFHKACVNII